MPPDAKIFVIDDDDAMRDSLEFMLTAAGFATTTFDGAAKFWETLPILGFGCIVTDIRMPEIDGLELLRRLKAASINLPVIVMTGHGDVPLAVEAMKLGAVDFLEKPFEEEKLVRTLNSALQACRETMRTNSDAAELAERFSQLTPRERQVMEGLVSGLSNKRIAKKHNISPRTVEVYRANVMTKIQASNISELIKSALRSGMFNDY